MSESQPELQPPVLVASVHDVRYFAALLRGVNFVNRATITVTQQGMTVTVEEARTLLGTAFIFSEVFDEYTYHAEPPPRAVPPPKPKRHQPDPNASETEPESEDEEDKVQPAEELDNAAFEIPLNTLIECLNIFGTASALNATATASGPSGGGGPSTNSKQAKKWRRAGDGDSDGEGRAGGRGLEAYFGPGAGEKRTGMRLSYSGAGYPLTLIVAEDAAGPTATCEITTFDPEPQLELHYDDDQTYSSWLRDALSELDPSCERLTFIGNPPTSATQRDPPVDQNTFVKPKPIRNATMRPMLRIQATGAFGSTEMDYPNDRDVLETFECTRSVSFSYRFGHISRTLKALQSSFKTSLRIDQDGLLSLQFLMPKPGKAGAGDAFIEFRCLALDDEF
ncbi:Rad1-domain-containing protein [Phlegmacium glaucopus]|nr:Rad1-domain-containing protein [Phlegmacium glaucopus]